MYSSVTEIVEKGITRDVFINPNHTYTKQLMDSIPGKLIKKKKKVSKSNKPKKVVRKKIKKNS